MSGKANAVLWLGLILIALNLIARWGDIKSVIFAGSGTGGGGTINLAPPIPGIPKVRIPGTSIVVSQTQPANIQVV